MGSLGGTPDLLRGVHQLVDATQQYHTAFERSSKRPKIDEPKVYFQQATTFLTDLLTGASITAP